MEGKFGLLFRLNQLILSFAGRIKWLTNFVFSHYRFTIIKPTKELDNCVSDPTRKCYIIGLGPSLKEVDIDKINGDTIVLNRFYKVGQKFSNFVPTYYLLSDVQFADNNNIKDFEECLKTYDGKETTYILDSRFNKCPLIEHYKKNNYFYISEFTGLINDKKKYSLSKPLPILFNTVCSAIFIAICMGYKEIVLLGCDFNSFATPIPQHCYKEEKEGKLRSLAMELYCYSFSAITHEDLQRFALNNGAKIINSTKGTLIDAYPVEIESSLYK